MTNFFLSAIAVMIFVVIFQIAKASEYVSVLKGEVRTRKQSNRINAFLLITFLIVGLIGAWYCNKLYYDKTLFPQGSASVEGEKIDTMMWITFAVTGLVFFITQILLFYFCFKYQDKDDRKAFYFPHNNTLELIWTVVPAIFLTVLVSFGLKYWFKFTSDAPNNSLVVEITGHQFGWDMRYAGDDGIFGKKKRCFFCLVSSQVNQLTLLALVTEKRHSLVHLLRCNLFFNAGRNGFMARSF